MPVDPTPTTPPPLPSPLSEATVRKVASLARLAITDEEVARYQHQLSDVLNYIERIRALDLEDVEPLTHVGDTTNRARPDDIGPMLTNADAMALAPDALPPFIKVPKVIGDGAGA
jgi:aspartyl-tRNA(Asn)/glutamyl-tRNA(Gln) amidotransferase subunit C